MLQYLVILLDDTSAAICHADNPLKKRCLMPLDTLRKAIIFGMKENLMIQFVYPDYELPKEYDSVIESIDHTKIGRDIKVYDCIPETVATETIVVLRISITQFLEHPDEIAVLAQQGARINICYTDIEHFNDEMIEKYEQALSALNATLVQLYKAGKPAQVNILTDRLQLKEMHNCGAGVTNITIAPNGKFYLCPAFYYDEKTGIDNRMNHHKLSSERSVGDLENGLNIPNQQLLRLNHAPLCRRCDAFHCNRCIWLNQKLTWDVNTPSRQQCVMAHIERNAARQLLIQLAEEGFQMENEITEINYLDPFDVREQLKKV